MGPNCPFLTPLNASLMLKAFQGPFVTCLNLHDNLMGVERPLAWRTWQLRAINKSPPLPPPPRRPVLLPVRHIYCCRRVTETPRLRDRGPAPAAWAHRNTSVINSVAFRRAPRASRWLFSCAVQGCAGCWTNSKSKVKTETGVGTRV